MSASSASSLAPDFLPAIHDARSNPQRLEALYQTARDAGAEERFREALLASYREFPTNLLYAAWYYRLQLSAARSEPHARAADWQLAIPISVALGLVYFALSDPAWVIMRGVPYLAMLWAPLAALAILWFVTLVARCGYVRAALVSVGLIALSAYVLTVGQLVGSAAANTYLTLMALHVPLLAGCAVGLAVLGWRSSASDRFGFLTKSIEVIATAGVAAIAGGIFVGLTYAIFQAIGVTLPDVMTRLLVAGGAGLIPVLAVAAVYDPRLAPHAQDFRRGFARVLAILMRALLPLTLLVLVIYVGVIPFNFAQPFTNRDVLIVFNVLLFAVLALLVGVTPVAPDALSTRMAGWLRAGIALLAALVVLVSLYALAAVLYRTFNAHLLTMNRAVVIGWNIINIALLVALLASQIRRDRSGDGAGWIARAQGVFKLGSAAYLVWALLLALALPWALPA
jgi:hypothetical protein